MKIGVYLDDVHARKHIDLDFVHRVGSLGERINYGMPKCYRLSEHHRLKYLLLALEVVIDGTFALACRLGNMIHAGLVVPVFVENAPCHLDYGVAVLIFFFCLVRIHGHIGTRS